MKKSTLNRWRPLIRLPLLTLTALLLLNVAPALAHYPWLTVLDDDPITFEIGWGHDFPTDDLLAADRMDAAALILPDGTSRPLELQAADRYSAGKPAATGLHLLAVEQVPSYYSRTPDGGRRGSRAEYPAAVSCSRTHNTMKALISRGPGGDPAHPVGHPLEIVPLADPGMLTAGEVLPLKVLLDGRPYDGELTAIWADYAGEEEFPVTLTADAQGRAELKLAAAGHWLVMAETRRDYPDPDRCDHLVYRSILTFHTR